MDTTKPLKDSPTICGVLSFPVCFPKPIHRNPNSTAPGHGPVLQELPTAATDLAVRDLHGLPRDHRPGGLASSKGLGD